MAAGLRAMPPKISKRECRRDTVTSSSSKAKMLCFHRSGQGTLVKVAGSAAGTLLWSCARTAFRGRLLHTARLKGRRQFDNLQPGRGGGISGKDVQVTGIVDDGNRIAGWQRKVFMRSTVVGRNVSTVKNTRSSWRRTRAATFSSASAASRSAQPITPLRSGVT
jgi:hypothetical protein